MMGKLSDNVGMNYPASPDSIYRAQPVVDFVFLWEEVGLAKKRISVDKMEDSQEQ